MPEHIPSDVYELLCLRRDRRGLTLVFEGARWKVTAELGFLCRSVDRTARPAPSQEAEALGRETGLLYERTDDAEPGKTPWRQLVFLTANDRIEVIAGELPAVTVLPRRGEATQEVLQTPLGPVELLADGQPVPYRCTALPLKARQFEVEGRWRLDASLPGTAAPVEVVCRIAADPALPVTGGPETDEALALLSLGWQNHKLCIGTEGDLPGVTCHYEETGLRLRFLTGPGGVSFYLAWLTMTDPERQELYPWLAADPSLDETRRRP